MNINIQTVHFDADVKLLDVVQKKLEKLTFLVFSLMKIGKAENK